MVVTDAYDLDAEWVFHAAAMPADGAASERSVRKATRNALETADDQGVQTMVLPALGTGEGGLDLADGVRAMAEEIDDHEPTALEDVQLIAYGDEPYEQIREIADDRGV